MIQLTRLNNSKVIVNSDLIKFVEQSPDTVLTLLNGEKILVQEPADEVVGRVVQFRRQVIAGLSAGDAIRMAAFPPACGTTGNQGSDQRENGHPESEG